MKGYEVAYAIVREDVFASDAKVVTVKSVVWEPEKAVKEVIRLNKLNSAKGAHYYATPTRVQKKIAC
jgi:hypothetical protein